MNREQTNTADHENQLRLTRRGRIAAGLAVTGLAASATFAMGNHIQTPEMHGTQPVRIVPGDTLTDIVVDNVEGGADEVKNVIDYVVDTNPEVFEDGTAKLGSEDLGEVITIPESVEE